MLSESELQELEETVLAKICPICIERDMRGHCIFSEFPECPISLHLHRLVDIVENIHSRTMRAYTNALRSRICPYCPNGLSARGECNVRAAKECALDAYLLPIVQVIDEYLTVREPKLLAE